MAIASALVGTAVWLVHKKPSQKGPISGFGGDTVVLLQESKFWVNKWTVSECLQVGDYYHTSSLYVVPIDNVLVHEHDFQYQQHVQLSESSRTIGDLGDFLYLMKGSFIEYRICLSSDALQVHRGKVFVFNELGNYYNFLTRMADGSATAVYSQVLYIGKQNETICNHMHFSVSKTSFYFVTAESPTDVSYTLNVTVHQVYLNNSDYTEQCQVYQDTPCEVVAPEHSDSYTVLAYIHRLHQSDPPVTHLCADPTQFAQVNSLSLALFIVATLVLICTVFILLTVFVVILYAKFRCYTRRYGYSVIS